MKKELCTLKACGHSKDFIIAMEALIKSLDYQKKINWCFASTFTEADSEPSQTSKIELFADFTALSSYVFWQKSSS